MKIHAIQSVSKIIINSGVYSYYKNENDEYVNIATEMLSVC